MTREWRVTVTEDDLQFLQRSKKLFESFAEAFKRQNETRALGTMDAQVFHCEQFLVRVEAARDVGEEPEQCPDCGKRLVYLQGASAFGMGRPSNRCISYPDRCSYWEDLATREGQEKARLRIEAARPVAP